MPTSELRLHRLRRWLAIPVVIFTLGAPVQLSADATSPSQVGSASVRSGTGEGSPLKRLSRPGYPKILAARHLKARRGGTVSAPNGVAIIVPPRVMTKSGIVRVVALRPGVYDMHIEPRWNGRVVLRFPTKANLPLLAHKARLEGVRAWVLEDAIVRHGFLEAEVTSLSPFDIIGCAKKLIPPTKNNVRAFITCLIDKRVVTVPKAVAQGLLKFFPEYNSCELPSLDNIPLSVLDVLFTSCALTEPPVQTTPTPTATPTATPTSTPTSSPPTPTPTSPPTSTPPPPSGPRISLSKAGAAPAGYWYSVSLTGFAPGTSIALTCRDSVDPQGFWSQTFTISGSGTAGDSTLCYSADGPDHWVTGGGYESNHVPW